MELKTLVIAAVLMMGGAAAQGQTVACSASNNTQPCEPQPCSQSNPGTVMPGHVDSCIPIKPWETKWPNGNSVKQLANGEVWVTIHKYNDFEMQMPMGVTGLNQIAGAFTEMLIANRPESDIVNGPQSDKIQIQGDCLSQTYQVMGGIQFSGKNGSGYPMDNVGFADLMNSGQAGVVRRPMPGTPMEDVFKALCK